jgi:hypothetical protein
LLELGRRSILLLVLAVLGGSLTNLAMPVAGQKSTASSDLINCINPPISSGNLSLSICTSRVHYSFGETVNFVAILSNAGPASLQLSTLSSSVFVIDRLGSTRLREANLDQCFTSASCSIPAGHSIIVSLANWSTGDPFFQATISGPYTSLVSVTACPTNQSCLEANLVTIKIVVSVPHN